MELEESKIGGLTTEKLQEEFYDSSFHAGGSFGVRVSGGGRRVFFLIYRLHGKRKRVTLGQHPSLSLAEARQRAQVITEQVGRGRDPASEKASYRASPTAAQLVELFLEDCERRSIAKSTLHEYRRIARAELLPYWRDRKAQDISPSDVNAVLRAIAEDRQSLTMAKRTLSLIKNLFSFGVKKAYLQSSPAENCVLLEIGDPHRERERVLNMEEVRALWQAANNEEPIISAIFHLLLLSGQKPGDIMAMRWQDINLDWWKVKAASGIEQHEVFLSLPALQVLRNVQPISGGGIYVFPGKAGSHIVNIRKAAMRIQANMSQHLLNETVEHWSPIDIRKTVEVHLRRLKIRPDVVDRILHRGPSNPVSRRTYETYNYRADMKQALSRWAHEIHNPDNTKPSKKRKKPAESNVIPLFSE
jgi:integrase